MMDPDEKASAALAALEQANYKSLMKATEEMVTKARLDQIARDHKSMGAILDDRVLYKIEEPKKRNKNQPYRSAMQLQRDAELLEAQEANNAEKVRLDAQAAELQRKSNDYSVEQQIWKEKSGPAVYSQARRFQFPELQKFKESMSHEQQVQFRRRTNAALITLADKFRAECKEMKTDMDLNGVFHPEANAHRVHCIYLMKLYKGIRSDTIEDPILRQMKREEEQRAADLIALQAQKQELLRSMEAADMANLSQAQLEMNAVAEAKRKAAEAAAENDNKEFTFNDAGSVENSLETGSMVAGSVATNSVTNLSVQISKVSLEKAPTMTPGNRNSMVSFAQGAATASNTSAKTSAGTSAKISGAPTPKSGAPTPKSSVATPKPSPAPTPKGGLVKKKSAFFEVDVDHKKDFKEDRADPTQTTFGPSSTSAKNSAPLNRSTSMSAMSGSAKHTTPLSTSGKHSSVPVPINTTQESRVNTVNNSITPMSARRSSHTKSAPVLTPGGARRRLMSGISEDIGINGSQSTDRISSPEREKNLNSHTREKDKLFKRIKTNKLGHAEAKTLLEDEASKLDLAESFSLKRTRDKNSILDTEMSDWMLSSVQKAQIGKTSAGTAMLTTGGLSQHLKLPASSIVTEFNDAIKKTSASPTKMLPFDTFHEMFSSYSQQHPSAISAAELPPVAAVTPSAGLSGKGEEGSATGAKKSRRRRQTDGALGVQYNNDTGSLVSSIDEDSNSRLSHRSKSSFLLPIDTNNKIQAVEPTNLVKTLAEQDANFEAYLKLAQHQQDPNTATTDTQSKMRHKLNASISAPRRVRKANPLGQNAINLVDSRGRASKDSRRGFSNIFQNVEVSVAAPEEEETDGAASKNTRKSMLRIDSHVSIMGTDNIMGRLKKLDEDDRSFPSVTSLARSSMQDAFSPDPRIAQSLNGSSSFMSPSSRTSSPNLDNEKSFKSSRNSRSRRRLQSSDAAAAKGPLFQDDDQDGEEGYIPPPDPDQSMQDKLVSAWDTLQMPAAQRFGFMHKYSTDENSMEMGRAVDMWSECALLVACVAELNRLLNKIKSGNCIMPLTKSFVLRTARSKITPLLASSSEQFIPPTMSFFHPGSVHQKVPLSAAALSRVHEIIESLFVQYGHALSSSSVSGSGRRDYQVYDLGESQALMTKVVAEIAIMLKKALKTVQVELDDVVPYGPRGCKEWIFGIAGLGKKNASSGALEELDD